MQQTGQANHAADPSEPPQDRPTRESVARARVAQQRERAAFTEITGVAVNDDGQPGDWRTSGADPRRLPLPAIDSSTPT